MLKSLDNSNGVQYYGGNDPAKMSGRFKKGGGRGASRSGGGSGGSGGLKGASGGKGSLNSLDKFAPAAIKAIRSETKDGLALIADVRDRIGSKADRQAFDSNLKAMQARGEVQTVTGRVPGMIQYDPNRREIRDGISTPLGGDRVYVRLA